MKKALMAALAVLAIMGQNAMAAAQDWSSITTEVGTEISAVMPVALGVFGTITAVVVGKKVLKRVMS